jgi:hypothetical protein
VQVSKELASRLQQGEVLTLRYRTFLYSILNGSFLFLYSKCVNGDVLKIITNEENIFLALIMFPIVFFLLSFHNLANPFQNCF